MFTHEPPEYDCFICRLVTDAEGGSASGSPDVIYHDSLVTAFLGIWHWPPIPLDIIVVPNRHIENLYCLPSQLAPDIQRVTRAMALTLKNIFKCDGVTIRQHNEPAGGQDVWHYHVHVIPRFENDGYGKSDRAFLPDHERLKHANRLRDYIAANQNILFSEMRLT